MPVLLLFTEFLTVIAANIISYSKSDVFTHYISSGGIWRTDAPKLDEYEAQDEVNVFYFSDAFLNGVHVSFCYEFFLRWGGSPIKQKNLMNEFGEAKDNIVIFSGLRSQSRVTTWVSMNYRMSENNPKVTISVVVLPIIGRRAEPCFVIYRKTNTQT